MLLVDWMEQHAGQISGLGPRRPLVLQIDRLTNEQLLAIVRSADPMAMPPPAR
jgi:hypothetical protein